MVKAYQSSSATTAGVKAFSITLIGVNTVSKKPPRRHADQMPMAMPMPKREAVAAPTRNSVQPAAQNKQARRRFGEVDGRDAENRNARGARYSRHTGPTANRGSHRSAGTASIWSGRSLPRSARRIRVAGSPGISRGIRKLRGDRDEERPEIGTPTLRARKAISIPSACRSLDPVEGGMSRRACEPSGSSLLATGVRLSSTFTRSWMPAGLFGAPTGWIHPASR